MRAYEKSHPWIRFQFQPNFEDYRLWLHMGEVSSKCQHLSGVPLRPDFAKRLNEIFLAKGVMATTAIEGNTLSEEQVLQRIDNQLELPPSQDYLRQEIDNVLRVCNDEIREHLDPDSESPKLSPELIKRYNREVLYELNTEEEVVPGAYRLQSVIVGSVYRGAPAEDCEYLVARLCDWLNEPGFEAPHPNLEIPFAVVRAVLAHVYLAWIHPFGDGNGRTARLLEFHILFSSGIPLPAAHLLSDHYNKTRANYYRQLDRASKSGGDLMPFLNYALEGLLDGLRDQISQVKAHQMTVAWENYVHSQFQQKKNSEAQKRRRDLVLELSGHDWVQSSEVELLTPVLAQAYALAGDRMLKRDLNALATMGLIERKRGKLRAKTSIVQAFLAARVRKEKR